MSQPPTFRFEGHRVPFTPGQSIGAALWAAGWRELRRTPSGSARGMFCGIGVCHECHVVVNGRADQRACLTAAQPDQRVAAQSGLQPPAKPVVAAVNPGQDSSADVVVIGGGPAGMAAALAAAERGAHVVLLDSEPRLGGQYWRHGASGVGERHHDVSEYQRLDDALAVAAAHGQVEILTSHRVWRIETAAELGAAGAPARPGEHLVHAFAALDPQSPDAAECRVRVSAPSVVIATGAFDRVLPIPGWDLPGVITPGAAQAMLKQHEVLAGRRVVVAGTGPFLIALAAELTQAGARVPAVVEAGDGREWLGRWRVVRANRRALGDIGGWLWTLARQRVSLRPRQLVVAAHGRDRLEAVTVARLDAAGNVVPGSGRWVPCDTLALGWGFTPRLDLARQAGARVRADQQNGALGVIADPEGRAGAAGILVAGEVRGVAGARHAVLTGEAAGIAAAAWARGRITTATGEYLTRLRALDSFAVAVHAAQRIPRAWVGCVSHSTVLCRCEDVSAKQLAGAISDLGADDAHTAKLLSRCGMGWCQGRVCGEAVATLVAEATGRRPVEGFLPDSRPVCEPVTFGALLLSPEEFADID